MTNSILDSVKKMIGLTKEYTQFDPDIIMHINTTFGILQQLGAGDDFSIEDDSATWSDYFGDRTDLEMIKTYIYMKVRLMFDPPQSSSTLQAVKDQIAELEWRINVQVDPKKE